MNTDKIQIEIEAQSSYKTMYGVKHFALFLCMLPFALNGFAPLFMLTTVAQIGYHAYFWPAIAERLAERLTLVTYKQQITNLFVLSMYPTDPTPSAEFEKVLQWLKKSENVHEVRVYLVLFQDACTFCSCYDSKGVLRSSKEWRQPGSAYETWEQYVEFCTRFQNEKNDLRLRELRENKAGYEWVNQNVLNQIVNG